MAVLDIRGTHGSGKSWCVHQVIKKYRSIKLVEGKKVVGYHLPDINTGIIGTYERVCGGTDGMGGPVKVIPRLLEYVSKYRHVIYEGITISHTFGRYNTLAEELSDYIFLFLDTPLEVCVERVRVRREERGAVKLFDPKHVIGDHKTIYTTVRTKLANAGKRTVVLDWQDPIPKIISILEQ